MTEVKALSQYWELQHEVKARLPIENYFSRSGLYRNVGNYMTRLGSVAILGTMTKLRFCRPHSKNNHKLG
jgi:hypothetical protein